MRGFIVRNSFYTSHDQEAAVNVVPEALGGAISRVSPYTERAEDPGRSPDWVDTVRSLGLKCPPGNADRPSPRLWTRE